LQLAESKPAQPPPGAREALRTADFVIFFEIQEKTANPRQIAIRSTIFNLTDQTLPDFTISYGVPLGWTLEPNATHLIQHILVLENRGSAPLAMKKHTTYMFGFQPLTSDDTLNPIFD
jgi:hypothetical protein